MHVLGAPQSCPVPSALVPVLLYIYDSTVTLGRQVESPVRLTMAISSILYIPSQKAAAESLVITTPSLYVIVA
jgi:hypothetical protein